MAVSQSGVASAPVPANLCDAIEEAMEVRPGEEVDSVHVFGNCYRCNWWVKDTKAHAMFTGGGRIIRSQFLRVTKVDDKLVIENLSKRSVAP